MMKKILLLTLLACTSITSSCFAMALMKMGPMTGAETYQPNNEAYYLDSDSITVNRANKTIEYSECHIHSKEEYKNKNGKMIWRRQLVDFSKFNSSREITLYTLLEGDFYQKHQAIRVSANYIKRNQGLPQVTWNIDETDSKYTAPTTLYKEFAYLLDMPNLDGTPYVTPKSLGLNWIKSTSEFGVFYDPKSIKSKNDSVNAKIYIWYPSINKIEVMNGKFDYTDSHFKPTSAKFIRISDGECVESYKQGLIPGIVGDKLYTYDFENQPPIKIAADFFKTKLVK